MSFRDRFFLILERKSPRSRLWAVLAPLGAVLVPGGLFRALRLFPAPPGRPRRRDETRRTGRTGRNDLTDEMLRSDGLLDLTWTSLEVIFGHVWGRTWTQHQPPNETFSTTPFSRHPGHEQLMTVNRFGSPGKRFRRPFRVIADLFLATRSPGPASKNHEPRFGSTAHNACPQCPHKNRE